MICCLLSLKSMWVCYGKWWGGNGVLGFLRSRRVKKKNLKYSVKLRFVLWNTRKNITSLEKIGKPGSILTEDDTILIIFKGKKVKQAEFHWIKGMLVDTRKYPPVIKSHGIYKSIQPCGSLVLQLFKMGVTVGEKSSSSRTLAKYNIKMF